MGAIYWQLDVLADQQSAISLIQERWNIAGLPSDKRVVAELSRLSCERNEPIKIDGVAIPEEFDIAVVTPPDSGGWCTIYGDDMYLGHYLCKMLIEDCPPEIHNGTWADYLGIEKAIYGKISEKDFTWTWEQFIDGCLTTGSYQNGSSLKDTGIDEVFRKTGRTFDRFNLRNLVSKGKK